MVGVFVIFIGSMAATPMRATPVSSKLPLISTTNNDGIKQSDDVKTNGISAESSPMNASNDDEINETDGQIQIAPMRSQSDNYSMYVQDTKMMINFIVHLNVPFVCNHSDKLVISKLKCL